MNKFTLLFILVLAIPAGLVHGQGVRISTDNADPDASSMLDISSTSKGILIPRMTTAQRTSISGPATGLMIYQTDGTPGFYYYNGSGWIYVSQPAGTAGGDLTGSYPNPAIGTGAVDGNNIQDGSITNTDINTAANISGTKISPNFTNQWITMTDNTASGQSRLQYNNDLGSAGISLFGSTFGTAPNILRVFNNTHPTDGGAIDFITDGIIRLYIGDSPNSGNVGIGTNAPNYKLDVRGTIGNNATLYHSDLRWKKDIRPVENSLDMILLMRGVYFKWRDDEFTDMEFDTRDHVGFIAQEVEEVIPDLVITAKDGYKSVEYANVTALLVNAMKEQQAMIEALQDRIRILEEKITENENLLEAKN